MTNTSSRNSSISTYAINYKGRSYTLLNRLLHILLSLFPYYVIIWNWNWIEENFATSFNIANFISTSFVLSTFAVTIIFFFVLYKCEFKFIEQFKTTTSPWPWKIMSPDKWNAQWKRNMRNYVFNAVIGIILSKCLIYISEVRTDRDFPSILTHLVILQICNFFDGFFFYWVHRMLHLQMFYKPIHKEHHRNIHSIAFTAIDAHWFEFIFGNFLPKFINLFIFKRHIHIVTFTTYLVMEMIEPHFGHCGYSFPISPFNRAFDYDISPYHNFHHLKNNANYSLYETFFWDRLFGTDKAFREHIKKSKINQKTD